MEFPTDEIRELLNLDDDATVAEVVTKVRELIAGMYFWTRVEVPPAPI